MKGGENGGPAESGDKKYDLTNLAEFQEFIEFVEREFTSSNKNNEQYIRDSSSKGSNYSNTQSIESSSDVSNKTHTHTHTYIIPS